MAPIIFNRRYYDEYFYNLCVRTAKQIELPVYMEHLSSRWIDAVDSARPAVVFVSDYLTDGENFSRWNKDDLAKLNSRKHPTIIATAVNHAESDWQAKNLYFVHTGSDMLFQQLQYPQLTGCIDKNFSNLHHWVCLCRLPRKHRVIALCVLFGLDVTGGHTSIGEHSFNNKSFDDWYNRDLDLPENILYSLRAGWQKFISHSTFIDSNTYNVPSNHNALNFDLNLKHIYSSCAVEIVLETTCFNRGQFISEKYLNSIYGCNFPILIGNTGTIAYLRNHGFDVFDDVIDHSYDLEPDPILRIYKAIENNKRLLLDRDFSLTQWRNCQPRFLQNLNFARNNMYTHFQDQFNRDLTNLLKKLELLPTHYPTGFCKHQ